MATLRKIDGRSLVGDVGPGLAVLRQAFGTPQSREAQRGAKEQAEDRSRVEQEALGVLGGGQQPGLGELGAVGASQPGQSPLPDQASTPDDRRTREQQALIRLGVVNPQAAQAVLAARESGDDQAQEALRRAAETGLRQAAFIKKQPDFAAKQRALTSLANESATRGEPLDRIIQLQNMDEPQLDLELQRMEIAGKDIQDVLRPVAGTEQFEPVLNEAGEIVGQRNKATNKVIPDPRAAAGGGGGLASAKTEILADGSTIQALPNGEVDVKNPAGESVTGPERLAVLGAAQTAAQNQARAGAGQKAAGAAAISRSEKAIDSLSKIKTSVANINKAIALIDEGAQTGPIRSRLPSIRSSSIALDNVQKSMGLDVIGTTTFGALSKGELDLALSKALPTGLAPDALREWLVEKKDAQEKLAGYLENAAIFLGIPGNTSADWVAQQKELRDQAGVAASSPDRSVDDLIEQFRTK